MLYYAVSIAITVIVSALIIAVEHYFPWQLMMGKRPHQLLCYVLGVLAILLPYTVLLMIWWVSANVPLYLAALALWIVVAGSGFSTLACYGLDRVLLVFRQLKEHQEREALALSRLEKLGDGYVSVE